MKLCVNVDHVATLRQARRTPFPDPVEAARLAEDAGAHGITVHLRGDRRHIQEGDLALLRRSVRGKLNLEMAATEEMLRIASAVRPDQATLVPERPDELTTEGGLNLLRHESRIADAARRLVERRISVSLFVDPDPNQLARLEALKEAGVSAFELNTDAYSRAYGDEEDRRWNDLARAVEFGPRFGLGVYAGHGLNVQNVGRIAKLEAIEEVNIGHAIVSRAVLVGMGEAVREMLGALATARATV